EPVDHPRRLEPAVVGDGRQAPALALVELWRRPPGLALGRIDLGRDHEPRQSALELSQRHAAPPVRVGPRPRACAAARLAAARARSPGTTTERSRTSHRAAVAPAARPPRA